MSLAERELLFAGREKGETLRAIAGLLGRSHTTLSRELRRNRRETGAYLPCSAHSYACDRIRRQRSAARLKSPLIYEYVLAHLKMGWSPETIAGRLALEHPGLSIHHESIYRFIYWDNGKGLHLWRYLTRARQKRMKKFGRKVQHSKTIHDAVSIEKRPEEANKRSVVGHWETDNLEGTHSDKAVISTTVERVTRYTLLTKLADSSAQGKYEALVGRLSLFPEKVRKSIIADNGHENTRHKEITNALKMPMYFCHPYTSCEKGGVESMNGRIRRRIPKRTRISMLPESTIAGIEHWLNNTPRKCLGYLTPKEMMLRAIRNSAYDYLPLHVQLALADQGNPAS